MLMPKIILIRKSEFKKEKENKFKKEKEKLFYQKKMNYKKKNGKIQRQIIFI